MQAGRELEPGELDVLVAETLGWVFSEKHETWSHNATYKGELPKFSTTWEGMGVLVEEARKQGIYLEYEHCKDGRYIGRAWKFCEDSDDWLSMPRIRAIKPPVGGTAPHAVSLVYLQSKGISV